MALSKQSQNLVSDTMTKADEILKLKFELEILIARWDLTDVGSIIEDLEKGAEGSLFPHLGKTEIVNAVEGFREVLTSIGNTSDGNAAKFVKMKG